MMMPQATYTDDEFYLRDRNGLRLAILHIEATIEYSRRSDEWEISQLYLIDGKAKVSDHNATGLAATLFDFVSDALMNDRHYREAIDECIREWDAYASEEACEYRLEQAREARVANGEAR